MTSTNINSLGVAAARNNADWCATVCRTHGTPGTFGEAAWTSARRTPPYYPDAVTLHPDAVPADILPGIDTASPGCSVKDSFGTLDLSSDGFVELFDAAWIHRPAGIPVAPTTGLRTEWVVSAGRLRDWQAAWHGDGETPDIFRPELLDDPFVRVVAVLDGARFAGGAVLNHSAGLVGISNVFAVDHSDVAAVWAGALTAAGEHFPGLPAVGYEQGDDLAPALDNGFATLGPLRIWLHGS
ncbi:hypothetical protein [Streptomyces sp. LN785]|uniref:hypothetical protein n=1 Tax=Streptomyces sp. LN785 TaxID=3112983 RepID=UPI0037244D29